MPTRSRIVFLDVLRALAILFVLWDHLVGQWLGQRGRGWLPLTKIDQFVTGPLDIVQDFGWLGVCLFFLISGFIISHVASSETRPEFAVKRILRIYPPLLVAILVSLLIAHWRVDFSVPDTSGAVPSSPSVPDALWSSSLINYMMVPQHVVLGVAWSLFIEICFYVLVFLIRPLLNHGGWASWGILAFIAFSSFTVREYGPNWFLLSVSLSYVPILVAGQALWLRWSGRIGTLHFSLITLAAWTVWILGLRSLQPTFLTAANSYGPSLVVAYALFLLALLGNDRIKANRVTSLVATRSYSLYLIHGPVGLFVLDATYHHLPFTLALILTLVVVGVLAELSYRYLEQPSQALARLIVRRRREHSAPVRAAGQPSGTKSDFGDDPNATSTTAAGGINGTP